MRSAKHPLGRLVGATLVLSPSAPGCGRLTFHQGLELGGANHLAQLDHQAVYEELAGWLA